MTDLIRIDERIRSHIPPLRDDEFKQLEQNILREGCRTPLVLWNGTLVDGHNRYVICEKYGLPFKTRDVDFSDLDEALEWVEENQLGRRNLTPDQFAYFIGRKYDRLKKRERGGGDRKSEEAENQKDHFDPFDPPQSTAVRIAAEHGVSEPTVKRAASFAHDVDTIAAAIGNEARTEILSGRSEGEPITRKEVSAFAGNLTKAIREGITFNSASDALKWAKKELKEEKKESAKQKAERRSEREITLADKIQALPNKQYGVIVADPEWRFEPYSRETGMDRAADNHYSTSELDKIKARDVLSIAADDCALFLWATVPMLPQALEVMAAWGFTYKSHFVWIKDRVGTGYWVRNKHELLLIGTRGNVPAPTMGTQMASTVEASVTAHSAKPEVFLEIIEQHFPTLPKIELNRRGPARAGWDAWGNEVDIESTRDQHDV